MRQFDGRLTHEGVRRRLSAAAPDSEAATPPAGQQSVDTGPAPGTDKEQVIDWLSRLHLLQGVPFHYLVPDVAMLPAESIRFFQVDDAWLEALLDGAYSVGFAGVAQDTAVASRVRVAAKAVARARGGTARRALLAAVVGRGLPAATAPMVQDGETPEALSGFLLRSAVVPGWPGLQARGWADLAGTQPLPIVRMEIVAPSLLLCLFAGVLARVDLQEPAEAVHFGLDPQGTGWQKDLRYADSDASHPIGSFTGGTVPVTLRGSSPRGVVDVDASARLMQDEVWTSPRPAGAAFTAAQFALEMVEGVQAVSFRVPPASGSRRP